MGRLVRHLTVEPQWLIGTMGAGLVLAARVRPRLIGGAFVVLTVTVFMLIVSVYMTAEYASDDIEHSSSRHQRLWHLIAGSFGRA